MEHEQIVAVAQEVTNGSKLEVSYVKPADVLNKRNYLKAQGVPAKELPKLKEGGSNPSKHLFKRTVFSLTFDERPYFQQMLEEQAQNLPPVKEPEYKHIRGAHYTKVGKDGVEKDYVRICIRSDRLKREVRYTTDARGRSEVDYKEIKDFLQKSARTDYESYNRQMEMTSTGKAPEVEIIQLNLDVDRIVKIVKE